MTAIVATMNKNGIALAADSAGSVGYKIFSANKIFQIGNRPIGMAIYGSSEFMQIPVGIIVDSYCKTLGTATFGTLGEYMESFVAHLTPFIHSHGTNIIPDMMVAQISEFLLRRISNDFQIFTEQNSGTLTLIDAKSILSSISTEISTKLGELATQTLIDGEGLIIPSVPVNNGERLIDKVELYIKDRLPLEFYEFLRDETTLLTALKQCLSKVGGFVMLKYLGCPIECPTTGCIFFGYGSDEIYPGVDSIELYYHIDGDIAYAETDKFSINNNEPISIRPYAQKDMVINLVRGISPTLEALFLNEISAEIGKLGTTVDSPAFMNNIRTRLQQLKYERFIEPMLGTIQHCSLSELAHIAETSVNLTSFKKRVTMVSEDVGGPTDVAVISKIDGFKWLKCKD